jgi:hypothetical protein
MGQHELLRRCVDPDFVVWGLAYPNCSLLDRSGRRLTVLVLATPQHRHHQEPQ